MIFYVPIQILFQNMWKSKFSAFWISTFDDIDLDSYFFIHLSIALFNLYLSTAFLNWCVVLNP